MSLAKRIHIHCIEEGLSLQGPTRINPAIFGLTLPPPKQHKKRIKNKVKDELKLGSEFTDALEIAEKIIGRKATLKDVIGSREDE